MVYSSADLPLGNNYEPVYLQENMNLPLLLLDLLPILTLSSKTW